MANPQTLASSDDDDQIDETVQSLAAIHDSRAQTVGPVQKFANRVTDVLARPGTVAGIVVLILAWIIGNLAAAHSGRGAPDPFPFPGLEIFATVCAFLVTLLILTTQRHEQDVSRRRDQLTLHMAVLTERKIAKVIALLEEQRRDNPLLDTRQDREADQMAHPVDPGTSLDKIEQSAAPD